MKTKSFSRYYLVIAIIVFVLFALTYIHPGPFYVSFRIPDPRTLLEIALGVIFFVALFLLAKNKLKKPTRIAMAFVLVSIALYFILRFIRVPGKTLWGFLVLSLIVIGWAAISVLVDKRK